MRSLAFLAAALLCAVAQGATAPLSCTDSAGNVFAFTPAVTTPPPPPPATSWGYYNGQMNWAGDFSYSAKINYLDTSAAPLSGKADIAVTLTGQWGAWQPYMSASFSYPTTGYTSLTFALKPTVSGQKWNVYFTGVGDVALPSTCGQNVLSYGPAPVVGKWATYTVPLSALCVAGKNVYKFAIQDQTGLSKNTFYVDNVGFQ